MELDGARCIVTGGASGLGAATAAALAARGARLTLLDVDAAAGAATADRLCAEHGSGTAVFLACDVTRADAQEAAFEAHWRAHGGLDLAVLNAGVTESPHGFLSAGAAEAERVAAVNFTAVVEGTRQVVRRLRADAASGRRAGDHQAVVLVLASASALFPWPQQAVYAASKAAAVHFVRSLAPLHASDRVRVTALCPRFIDTPMVARMRAALPVTRLVDGDATLLPVAEVVAALLRSVQDSGNAGLCLHIAPGAAQGYWQFRGDAQRRPAPAAARQAPPCAELARWATSQLSGDYAAVRVVQLSPDFVAATRLERLPLPPLPLPPGKALVRRLWAGVNASDVNFTSGRYFGTPAAAAAKLPFTAGFETVGVIAAVGDGVLVSRDGSPWRVGDAVGCFSYGGFAEYGLEDAASLLPIGPVPSPEAAALLTSGLTASIALEQAGRLRRGETLLVTAAAGGTGSLAVQLGVAAGAHVIATCGGPAKAELLRRLGAHRVIDHTAEEVRGVLKREYPKGVDCVYESVGGALFATALASLAPRGRLIVIGAMSSYAAGWGPETLSPPGTAEALLWRSAACVGFFLPLWAHRFRPHLARLVAEHQAGRLRVALDGHAFVGLERTAAAVARLQGGQSSGKVVLQVAPLLPPPLQAPARL